MNIHSTAVIHPKARIADGVSIGPYTVIGEHVTIGKDTEIASHVLIDGWTTIGERNRIHSFTSIGSPPLTPCTVITSALGVPAVPNAGCLASVAAPLGSGNVVAVIAIFVFVRYTLPALPVNRQYCP